MNNPTGIREYVDYKWGIVGDVLYSIVETEKRTDEGFVSKFLSRKYDIYLFPLPEEKIPSFGFLPYNDSSKKVNPEPFKHSYEAREFLINYLIEQEGLPKEEVERRIRGVKFGTTQENKRK